MVYAYITDFKVNSAEAKASNTGTQYLVIKGSYWARKDKDGNNVYQNGSITLFGRDVQKFAGLTKGQLINVCAEQKDARGYMKQDGNIGTTIEWVAVKVEKPFGSTTTQQTAAQPAQDFTSGAAGFDETENDLPF